MRKIPRKNKIRQVTKTQFSPVCCGHTNPAAQCGGVYFIARSPISVAETGHYFLWYTYYTQRYLLCQCRLHYFDLFSFLDK